MEPDSPQPVPKKSRKKTIGIVIGVIVVVFIAALIIPPLLNNRGNGDTIIASGNIESMNAGYYDYINFTIPSGAYSVSLTGSYTSNNNVEVGVLSSTQYGAFTQNPSTITSADWFSGDTQGTTINFFPL
jgi:hypothetical protein